MIRIEWIETKNQPADGLTNVLSRHKHLKLLKRLNMVNLEEKLLHKSDQEVMYALQLKLQSLGGKYEIIYLT